MQSFLIIVLFAIAVASCGRHEPGASSGGSAETEIFDQRIGFQQILQRLRDDDPGKVSRTIVQLELMKDRSEVSRLLLAVWAHDRAPFPDLNWAVLETQRARSLSRASSATGIPTTLNTVTTCRRCRSEPVPAVTRPKRS